MNPVYVTGSGKIAVSLLARALAPAG